MMTHGSLPIVSRMTNIEYGFINDTERVMLSPLWVYLIFYWCLKGIFIFYNGIILFTYFTVLFTHCCVFLCVTCMVIWNALSEMTKWHCTINLGLKNSRLYNIEAQHGSIKILWEVEMITTLNAVTYQFSIWKSMHTRTKIESFQLYIQLIYLDYIATKHCAPPVEPYFLCFKMWFHAANWLE